MTIVATDLLARVSWADGSETEHWLAVSDEPLDVLEEALSMSLADYLSVDEWPLDDDGLPLAWVSVVVEESN